MTAKPLSEFTHIAAMCQTGTVESLSKFHAGPHLLRELRIDAPRRWSYTALDFLAAGGGGTEVRN
jgi:hypothetical protein